MYLLISTPFSRKCTGIILNRRELRKLARKKKKKNKLLFSKKKSSRKNIAQDITHDIESKRKTTKKEKETKRKKEEYNDKDNLSEPPKKQIKTSRSKIKYDIAAEQEKDNLLLSYLSKKLKINNVGDGKNNNEEKLLKELEKDGFDSNLLKLTNIIFSEFQKSYKDERKRSKADKEHGDDRKRYSQEDEDKQSLSASERNSGDDQVTKIKSKSEMKENKKEKEKNKEQKQKKKTKAKNEKQIKEKNEKKIKPKNEKQIKPKNEKQIKVKKAKHNNTEEDMEGGERKIPPQGTSGERKKIMKAEKKIKKVNYPEESKKIEKFLMVSLNKTSEFNIKCIVHDICKYFHDLKDLKLKVIFNDILIKIISNHFNNVNVTDIHICICAVLICIFNSLIYQNMLKDFLKALTEIFKYLYQENLDLLKKMERINELNSNPTFKYTVNNINNEKDTENGKLAVLEKSNETDQHCSSAHAYLNNSKGNDDEINYAVSQKEQDLYQDFKIILRNLLKCFSLFYALNYVDFDCITDIINVLCENISINSVDNIIIILKICGMKLKSEDVTHLKYISEYLKKQIDNYIMNNHICVERSKLRFLIKDIDDLENGKMKFHFLNKFEFLFSILKEFENKYNFKGNMISFSFLKTLKSVEFTSIQGGKGSKKRKSTTNIKKEKSNMDKTGAKIENATSTGDRNNNMLSEEETNVIENKFCKLNYLTSGEEAYFNESHFNRILKQYKIQGILPKKIFIIMKNSLNVDECVNNLSLILKKKKNIPHVIQTVIQTLLYNKKYKVAYAKILSNISNIKNRIFLFSLKTIFINYLKNIDNYNLKKVLFLSKLFVFLLKEKLLNFQIFKFIEIGQEGETEKKQENSNISFFFKTVFILISLHDKSGDLSTNSELWSHIMQITRGAHLGSSFVHIFKKIIKKYIFYEVKNIVRIYPNFKIKYAEMFYAFLEKQKSLGNSP